MKSISVSPRLGWKETYSLTDDAVILETEGKDIKVTIPYQSLSPSFVQQKQKRDFEVLKGCLFFGLSVFFAYYALNDMPFLWIPAALLLIPAYYLFKESRNKDRKDLIFHEVIDGAVGLHMRYEPIQEDEVSEFAKNIVERIFESREARDSNKSA